MSDRTGNENERRTPSQATIDNTIAISKLAAISERTTSDVDKLVKHIEKFLPVHEKVQNIKIALYTAIATAVSFGIWITIQYFALSTSFATFTAVANAKHEELSKEAKGGIDRNKNQITYLKGVIRDMENPKKRKHE